MGLNNSSNEGSQCSQRQAHRPKISFSRCHTNGKRKLRTNSSNKGLGIVSSSSTSSSSRSSSRSSSQDLFRRRRLSLSRSSSQEKQQIRSNNDAQSQKERKERDEKIQEMERAFFADDSPDKPKPKSSTQSKKLTRPPIPSFRLSHESDGDNDEKENKQAIFGNASDNSQLSRHTVNATSEGDCSKNSDKERRNDARAEEERSPVHEIDPTNVGTTSIKNILSKSDFTSLSFVPPEETANASVTKANVKSNTEKTTTTSETTTTKTKTKPKARQKDQPSEEVLMEKTDELFQEIEDTSSFTMTKVYATLEEIFQVKFTLKSRKFIKKRMHALINGNTQEGDSPKSTNNAVQTGSNDHLGKRGDEAQHARDRIAKPQVNKSSSPSARDDDSVWDEFSGQNSRTQNFGYYVATTVLPSNSADEQNTCPESMANTGAAPSRLVSPDNDNDCINTNPLTSEKVNEAGEANHHHHHHEAVITTLPMDQGKLNESTVQRQSMTEPDYEVENKQTTNDQTYKDDSAVLPARTEVCHETCEKIITSIHLQQPAEPEENVSGKAAGTSRGSLAIINLDSDSEDSFVYEGNPFSKSSNGRNGRKPIVHKRKPNKVETNALRAPAVAQPHTHSKQNSDALADRPDCLWRSAIDPHGRPYYYNILTWETRWDKPPEMPHPPYNLQSRQPAPSLTVRQHVPLNASKMPSTNTLAYAQDDQASIAKLSIPSTTPNDGQKAATTKQPRKRTATCSLCKTCPCKLKSKKSKTTLPSARLDSSDNAVMKTLKSRLNTLEKDAEKFEDQAEAVRRELRKHRRIQTRNEKQKEQRIEKPKDRFLPDGHDLDSQLEARKSSTVEVTSVKEAQISLFGKERQPLSQPTLTQMLGISSTKEAGQEEKQTIASDGEEDCFGNLELAESEPECDCGEEEDVMCSLNSDSESVKSDVSTVSDYNGVAFRRICHDPKQGVTENAVSVWGEVVSAGLNSDGTSYEPAFNRIFDIDSGESMAAGMNHLLGLFEDKGSTSLSPERKASNGKAWNENNPVDLCILSQRGKSLFQNIKGQVISNAQQHTDLRAACPQWEENIAYALRQENVQDVDGALEMVHNSRAKLEKMKEDFLKAWQQQKSVLAVFELSLERSRTRLEEGNDSSCDC